MCTVPSPTWSTTPSNALVISRSRRRLPTRRRRARSSRPPGPRARGAPRMRLQSSSSSRCSSPPSGARRSRACGSSSRTTSTSRATSSAQPRCSRSSWTTLAGGDTSRPRAALPGGDRVLARRRVGGSSARGASAPRGGRPAPARAPASPRSPCTRRRAICRGRPKPRARRSRSWRPARMQTRRSSRLHLSARVRADLFLGHGLDREAAERALELEAAPRRRRRSTRASRSSSASGSATSTTSPALAATSSLRSVQRSTRATSRRSPTSCSTARCSSAGRGTGASPPTLGDQTHELFPLTGISAGASNVWRAYVDAHYGRVDAVRAAALQAGGVGEPIGRMLWERALGLAELAAGDARAAAPHLAAAVEALAETGFREPAVWRLDGDAVEGCSRRRRPRARRKRWSRSSRRAPRARRFRGALP